MSQIYSKQELGQLLSGFKLSTHISQLEAELHRSAIGIASKMERLSKSNPRKWNPKKVAEYKKQVDETCKGYFKKRLSEYVTGNPVATTSDVRKAGFGWDLSLGYGNRLNDAKREVGIDIERIYSERRRTLKERHKDEIISFLNDNRTATAYDIKEAGLGHALDYGYNRRLNDARRDAGILRVGYVSAAETSRMLGLSRERVSQFFYANRLEGYTVGRHVFISLDSIKNLMEKRYQRTQIKTQ